MKQIQKYFLVILLVMTSAVVMAQSNKPENPNAIGTPGNNSENKQLKEFLKNEQAEYEPPKSVSPTPEAKPEKQKEKKPEKPAPEPKPEKSKAEKQEKGSKEYNIVPKQRKE